MRLHDYEIEGKITVKALKPFFFNSKQILLSKKEL